MADTGALTTKQSSEVAQPEATWSGLHFTPRVDIFENDDELLVMCDMPGVRPDDLNLQFENRELILHGRVQPRQSGTRYLANEYGVGDFHRSFSIHESVDESRISADYKQGVLTIHLPKREEVKPRRIAIKAE